MVSLEKGGPKFKPVVNTRGRSEGTPVPRASKPPSAVKPPSKKAAQPLPASTKENVSNVETARSSQEDAWDEDRPTSPSLVRRSDRPPQVSRTSKTTTLHRAHLCSYD